MQASVHTGGRPITAADVCGVWQREGVASLAFCPVVAPEGSNVDFEMGTSELLTGTIVGR